ncbi:c-type cytochrome [Lysobacter enzymogenes]|uniref:c-type cytochrome n=1 Tax=Lysobacter enzymogenes TaxID=69 RepID=UPI001A96FA59|nr:cytochrome c [Lysobacter enzymogenes]QQP97224.1 cytochrome c [Lysobacter enzymogenes]
MNALLRTGLRLGGAAVAAGAAGAALLWSGVYDVGADAAHTRPVYALLEYARERSVAVRAGALTVPAGLDDAERVRRGAGNYAAMCAGCHLTPEAGPSELSRGLYPAPPNLSQREVDAASAFWTIKHGIKASGMPAWGGSMDDAHVWDLVAFLGRLPSLDAQGYRELVTRSDGHSHGGGESMPGHDHEGGHPHAAGAAHAHDAAGPAVAKPQDAVGAQADRHDDADAASAHGQRHERETISAPAKTRDPPRPDASAPPTHEHADGHSHQH